MHPYSHLIRIVILFISGQCRQWSESRRNRSIRLFAIYLHLWCCRYAALIAIRHRANHIGPDDGRVDGFRFLVVFVVARVHNLAERILQPGK